LEDAWREISQSGCGYTVTRARNVVVCSFMLAEIEVKTNDRSATDCSLASIATHIPFLWGLSFRGTANSAHQLSPNHGYQEKNRSIALSEREHHYQNQN
jgi:hypothetical protein